jgi:hypothetical protein
MDYMMTIFKKQGESLYALWIDTPGDEPQPGTAWQVVQTVEITPEEPIPAALCSLLLMSEATSDRLFRQITDTWLRPTEDDPLDDYHCYASREEASGLLNDSV